LFSLGHPQWRIEDRPCQIALNGLVAHFVLFGRGSQISAATSKPAKIVNGQWRVQTHHH
jgi:hypothetical protein